MSRQRHPASLRAPAPPVLHAAEAALKVPPVHAERPRVRVQTLGAARMVVGDQLLGLHNFQLFALMLRLVYTPGMAVRREDLLRELWPDLKPVRQRGNLRQALYKLRGLGIDAAIHGTAVCLDASQVDRHFAVQPSLETFEQDIASGAEPYGVFVPGFMPSTAGLAEWLEQTRAELNADVRRVLVDVLRQRRDRADWNGTRMVAKWILQLDPLNEDATLALAECIAATGSKVEAIAVLDRFLTELGSDAGDIRLPATLLRKRFTEATPRRRSVALVTDRYFVGRDEEMTELTLAMRRARWQDGSAVVLHGPAGMGKTRVLTELSRIAQLDGHRQVLVECRESISKLPLVALLEALPDLLSAPGAAGSAPESLMVIRRLLGLADEHGALDADSSTEVVTEGLTASERFERAMRTIRSHSIRHAVVDLVSAVSEEGPIFCWVEDAHWLDDASWEVLSDVMQRVNAMRVCIVLTSRYPTVREERPGRMPAPLTFRKLPPLALPHLQFLVESIAAEYSTEVPPDVEEWITGGCEGSPMMLRALLEHWLATGVSVGVPPTLSGLLDQRMDRLEATAQQALQAIALLGKFASLERIKLVLELPMHELIHALEQLELSGCLNTSHSGLVITHDLVRQVAVRKMSPLVETALRATIGNVLEAEYQRTEDQAILLEALLHIELSARPDVLSRFISKYEDALLESGRPASVLRAIGTLNGAMESAGIDRQLRRMQFSLESQNGAWGKALALLPGGIDLPSDPQLLTNIELDERLSFVECAYRSAPLADPNALARFAVSVVRLRNARIEQRLRAAYSGITIASNTCDLEVASDSYFGLQLTEQELLDGEKTQGLSLLYHTVFGSVDLAERLAAGIVARAKDARPTNALTLQCGSAGFVFRMIGKPELAFDALLRARSLALDIESPGLAEYPIWQLAQLSLETGRLQDAIKWTEELRKLSSQNSDEAANSYVYGHLCLLSITQNNRREAMQHLVRCKRNLPKIAPARSIAYSTALELAVNLMEPQWKPNIAQVDAAISRFELTSRFCASDLLASRVGESLIRLDHSDRARVLMQDYVVNKRRERSAPSALLQRVLLKLRIRFPRT